MVPAAGALPPGPPAPTGGLVVPTLDVAWRPPSMTAGDIEGLRKALSGGSALVVLLGPRLADAGTAAVLRTLPQQLDPALTKVASAVGPLFGVLINGRELPLERERGAETSPEGPRGPARYRWSSLAAAPAPVVALEGHEDARVLAIDDAEIDPNGWRRLPAHTVGSCEAAVQALAMAQEQSLALVEPFLDHADGLLAAVYRSELQSHLSGWVEGLEPFADVRPTGATDAQSRRRHACGRAAWDRLQVHLACAETDGPCGGAPRLFLVEGVRAGVVASAKVIEPDCSLRLDRDYEQEWQDAAAEAARVVGSGLDPAWSELAARLGAISAAAEALGDVCEPRRRRFAATDLAAFRQQLGRIGAALRAVEPPRTTARWVPSSGSFHVAGVGAVHELARFDAGINSPSRRVVQEANALRAMVFERARCESDRDALPMAVTVLSGQPRTVEFFGYFYEEELMCGDLPPLGSTPPNAG